MVWATTTRRSCRQLRQHSNSKAAGAAGHARSELTYSTTAVTRSLSVLKRAAQRSSAKQPQQLQQPEL